MGEIKSPVIKLLKIAPSVDPMVLLYGVPRGPTLGAVFIAQREPHTYLPESL
jgi:hypothetical protein